MLPGMGALKNVDLDDGAFKGVLALIDSMTPAASAPAGDPQREPQEAHRPRLRPLGSRS